MIELHEYGRRSDEPAVDGKATRRLWLRLVEIVILMVILLYLSGMLYP
jgi:hypothetical protein